MVHCRLTWRTVQIMTLHGILQVELEIHSFHPLLCVQQCGYFATHVIAYHYWLQAAVRNIGWQNSMHEREVPGYRNTTNYATDPCNCIIDSI